jgi:hypothetical protein
MDTFDGSTNWKFHGEKARVERAGHCEQSEFEGLSADLPAATSRSKASD